MRGTINWFNLEKGYGFAISEAGAQVFLDRRNVVEGQDKHLLVQGAPIEFEIDAPRVVDTFVEALNAGLLRDAGFSHRRPKPKRNVKSRRPAALRIRVVEEMPC
jgi:cold shock CspA family protein